MVFYGTLDLLAKPVFALVHLYSLRGCDLSKLQLQSGKFSGENQIDEKLESHHHHNSNPSQSDSTNRGETQAIHEPQMVAAPVS
jgi:bacteriorhodopsin